MGLYCFFYCSVTSMNSLWAILNFYFPRFKKFFVFGRKMPPFVGIFLSRLPYKLKWFVRKFTTSFVSAVLRVFAVGHSLKRCIAINKRGSPFNFLLCKFPVNSICYSCRGSVSFSDVTCRFFGNWYLRFLPVMRHAMQSLTLVAVQ